jgi:Fe2+ or Zn2+ uptake regulation protein
LLLEKLPTKEALFDKGIIINISDKSRVFCSNNDESIHHVFLHCTMSSTVWRKIFT